MPRSSNKRDYEIPSEGTNAADADEVAVHAADAQERDTWGVGEQEGRDMSMMIDVPHEAGHTDLKPIEYADLGPDKRFKSKAIDLAHPDAEAGASSDEGDTNEGSA